MQYILIHGLGQNSSSWNKTISYMVEQDHVICPELSSFLKEGDITYANLYHTFSEYCDNISEPLNLCGLSLGAVVALNYAIDNPEKVKSLILIAAQYEMPKVLLKLQNIIFRFIPETSFKNMGIMKKDFIKLTTSMMNLNFSKSLKNIPCPVLVVCGEKDSANKKASKNLAESITKAEIQFIKNAKHEVNIDAPKELAEILNDFYHRQQL
ncbi:alpha/beta hydrolase [Clostridium baratii]|uniref:Alpha/beta hydrolase fold family protein n=2 Tax=Clostridium baratii TaxID=1561 RepID=A0A0A7FWN5_9CLOT|nr:alpha/beta hydrolase [Clostridium baratii]AIY83300.1 alpha/beta hydrolase fold family protein [Clostridium baratii str. Sullivan]MDU1053265.1 alpha/beta hydrolase [Clostridium baratii]CUP10213.1 alpha/beta hydrolase [Clostridium baratii]